MPQSGSYVSRLSLPAIAEAVFLREAIEVAAAIHVAETADPDVLRALKRNIAIQEMLAADLDQPGLYNMDEELHALILQATGHPSILKVAADVGLRIERARRLVLPPPQGSPGIVEEHRAIVEAIIGRNKTVICETMAAHLRKLNERVRPLVAQYPGYFVPSRDHVR